MPTSEPTSAHNLDGYGVATIEWSRVAKALDDHVTEGAPERHTHWLSTTNPDGSPHVRPLGVLSVDGVWYFTSGPGTRKSRNLDRDPRCVVGLATRSFDLVVEGTAERVVDVGLLQTVAQAYADHGWPASVDGDGVTAAFSAPSAGPPPWHVYRVVASTVFALGTAEPFGATRFDLAPTTAGG